MSWSNQDHETLKDYLPPTLLEKWETKKERIKKIKLLDMVVELYDRK